MGLVASDDVLPLRELGEGTDRVTPTRPRQQPRVSTSITYHETLTSLPPLSNPIYAEAPHPGFWTLEEISPKQIVVLVLLLLCDIANLLCSH